MGDVRISPIGFDDPQSDLHVLLDISHVHYPAANFSYFSSVYDHTTYSTAHSIVLYCKTQESVRFAIYRIASHQYSLSFAETQRSRGARDQLLLKTQSSPSAADAESSDTDADAGCERKRARLSDRFSATQAQSTDAAAAATALSSNGVTLSAQTTPPPPMASADRLQRQASRGKSAFTIDAFLSNSTNAPNESRPSPTFASRASRCNAGVGAGAFSTPMLPAALPAPAGMCNVFTQSPLGMNGMSAFAAPNMAFHGASVLPAAAAAAPGPEQQIAFMLQQLLQQSAAAVAAAASGGVGPAAAAGLMGRDGALAALAAAAASVAQQQHVPQEHAGGQVPSWPANSLGAGEAGSRTGAARVSDGLQYSAASKSM